MNNNPFVQAGQQQTNQYLAYPQGVPSPSYYPPYGAGLSFPTNYGLQPGYGAQPQVAYNNSNCYGTTYTGLSMPDSGYQPNKMAQTQTYGSYYPSVPAYPATGLSMPTNYSVQVGTGAQPLAYGNSCYATTYPIATGLTMPSYGNQVVTPVEEHMPSEDEGADKKIEELKQAREKILIDQNSSRDQISELELEIAEINYNIKEIPGLANDDATVISLNELENRLSEAKRKYQEYHYYLAANETKLRDLGHNNL